VTTHTLSVGPLQPSHRTQIEEIVRASGVFSEKEVGVALELFDATGDDYTFVGAFDPTNALVGYACFGATPATDRTYDLYWIAVHPKAQRSGAGSALMSEVERRLDERHARLVIIETSSRDDYAPTRRFYHKRGYTEDARLRDFYAPGDDRVVFSKRLIGSSDLGGNAAARPLTA
jgi:ribosomal protein S18 acetylase RimI-like enzyme